MREDKGLNGDLDRVPMLTWIMRLKFRDDLELQREGEAELAGKEFETTIGPPPPSPALIEAERTFWMDELRCGVEPR